MSEAYKRPVAEALDPALGDTRYSHSRERTPPTRALSLPHGRLSIARRRDDPTVHSSSRRCARSMAAPLCLRSASSSSRRRRRTAARRPGVPAAAHQPQESDRGRRVSVCWRKVFFLCGLYDPTHPLSRKDEIQRLAAACSAGSFMTLALPLVSTTDWFNPWHAAAIWVIAVSVALAARWLVRLGVEKSAAPRSATSSSSGVGPVRYSSTTHFLRSATRDWRCSASSTITRTSHPRSSATACSVASQTSSNS